MYQDDEEKSGKLKIVPSITYGNIVQTLVVVAGVIFFVATASNNADYASKKVDALQSSMNAQMNAMQITINQGLQQLQNQIQSFPTYSAKLDQLEKSNAQQDSAIGGLDSRLRSVENETAIDSSRLDSIERASGLPSTRVKR